MRRYWFEFNGSLQELPPGLILGCGVTAHDYTDAISILRQKVFKGEELPEIKTKVENADISTLDNGHIRPNMGDPTLRGVWFPMGYELYIANEMRFLKYIFGIKDKHPPIQGDLSAFVRKSIPIIGTTGKTMLDSELMQLLVSEGVPEQEAIEIVLFLPAAFTRILIPNVNWQNYYVDYYGEHKQIERLYQENPRYLVFESETHRFFNSQPDSELLLNVAGRSAEFKAVNKLLLDGGKIEDIKVTPSYIIR